MLQRSNVVHNTLSTLHLTILLLPVYVFKNCLSKTIVFWTICYTFLFISLLVESVIHRFSSVTSTISCLFDPNFLLLLVCPLKLCKFCWPRCLVITPKIQLSIPKGWRYVRDLDYSSLRIGFFLVKSARNLSSLWFLRACGLDMILKSVKYQNFSNRLHFWSKSGVSQALGEGELSKNQSFCSTQLSLRILSVFMLLPINIFSLNKCMPYQNNIDNLIVNTMSFALKHLPAYYLNNPLFQQVNQYITRASIMQGMILYRKGNQSFLFLKDGDVHVPFDWQVYSLMRASSKLFINSGQCIRQEKGIYLTRQSYGDPHVQELYQSLLDKQRQKLMIITRQMQQRQIVEKINPQLYQLVPTPKFTSLPNLLQQVTKSGESPVLLQYGLNAMNNYFRAVDRGEPNYLGTLILSYFQGPFLPKYIGDKFQIPLDKYYNKAWTSSKIPCKMHNELTGDLTIQVFTKKT